MGALTLGGFLVGVAYGAVIGAAVGAVIGGITAAITGGSIGQGMLHGAIGGAVIGAVTGGIGTVWNALGTSTQGLSQAGMAATSAETAAGEGLASAGVATSSAGRTALLTTTTESSGSSWLGGLWSDLSGSFAGDLAADVGTEFGKQAVGAAISGGVDVYNQGKARDAASKLQDKTFEQTRILTDDAQKDALELQNNAPSGGVSGGSGPNYTIDELIERDLAAAESERTTTLARVDAELQGQKDLKSQEFAEAGANRELMAAGASALRGTSARTDSRSTETLTDVQDRIRNGENVEGETNTGVVVPVNYVPPEQQYV